MPEDTAGAATQQPTQLEIPPILEEVRAWVMADDEGTLRRTHVNQRPEINVQTFCAKLPETQ